MPMPQFTTAKQFVDYDKQLNHQIRTLKVLDALRTLPYEEAEKLLEAYCYKTDGDYGYGRWPDLDKDGRFEWL